LAADVVSYPKRRRAIRDAVKAAGVATIKFVDNQNILWYELLYEVGFLDVAQWRKILTNTEGAGH
jgi:hypothetical protein